MKPRPLPRLLLAATLLFTAGALGAAPAAKPESATAIALRKVAERYALTKSRIASLLDERVHPTPLPTKLPNPFYRVPELPATDTPPEADTAVVPAAPDVSDADTLAKFAAGLKISGLIMLNDTPRLTINSTLCKVGDVIPAGSKERPVFIQVQSITADELTLRLNDATQVLRVRK
jgi:hypothetical protein